MTVWHPQTLESIAADASEAAEVEGHFHTRARWFGKKAAQTATDWADNTLTPYRYGTGTMADAITAGQYSETMVQVASASSRLAKEDIRMPRLTIGVDKVWAQAWNATDNATIDFFVGIHGYVS